VCVLFFGFRFAGMRVGVLLIYFVSVLCSLVESCSMLFFVLLAFECTGCCAFLCSVVLLLVRLCARFHGVGYAGVGLSSMPVFVFENKLLARELSSRLALCDVFCCLRLC